MQNKTTINFAPILPLINANEPELFKVHKDALKVAKETYKKVWPENANWVDTSEYAFYAGVCFAVNFAKKEELKNEESK